MIDIKQALTTATATLHATTSSARLDAELLLSHVLNKTRTFFYTHPEAHLSATQRAAYQQLIAQRAMGTPVAYLTHQREFWSLPLCVSEATLIPRPETELLVELCLRLLTNIPNAHILELGTGSGAISLALAVEQPAWQLFACDISTAALAIAKTNTTRLNVTNLRLFASDWLAAVGPQRFNAILTNPPYIAANDPHLKQGDLRFEPQQALVSGHDGLHDIGLIIQHSYRHLGPQGLLLLEHGYNQGPAVIALLQQAGYQDVQCWQDGQGHDRISGGWRCE